MNLTILVILYISFGSVLMETNLKEFCAKDYFNSIVAYYSKGRLFLQLNRISDSKIRRSYHSWDLMIEINFEIYKTIHMTYTLEEGHIPDSSLSQPNYCPIHMQTFHEMEESAMNFNWTINDFLIYNDLLYGPQVKYTQMVFQTIQYKNILGIWKLDSIEKKTEETKSNVEMWLSKIPLNMNHVLSGGSTLCRIEDKIIYIFFMLTNEMNTSERKQFVTRLKITGKQSDSQKRYFIKIPQLYSERTTRPQLEFSLDSMNKTIPEFLGIDCKNIGSEDLFNEPIPTPQFGAVGYFPDFQYLDINLPECGLNYIPVSNEIHFSSNCFRNQLKNKRVLSFDRTLEDLKNQISKRIFGGQDAQHAESPWTVMIRIFLDRYEYRCAGVLITFEWVLTASHCLKNTAKDIVVGIGRDIRDFIDVRYSNRQLFYRHPNHDIALIKLKSPFPRHKNDSIQYLINTVCLPTGVVNTNYERATYFGYGLNDDSGRHPDILQKGEVELNPARFCSSKSFCARFDHPEQSRPCVGDSGGPLLKQIDSRTKRNVLIGVFKIIVHTTINATCSSSITSSIWAAIPHFIDWILTTIAENN